MRGGANQKQSQATAGTYQEDDGFNYAEFMKGTAGRRQSQMSKPNPPAQSYQDPNYYQQPAQYQDPNAQVQYDANQAYYNNNGADNGQYYNNDQYANNAGGYYDNNGQYYDNNATPAATNQTAQPAPAEEFSYADFMGGGKGKSNRTLGYANSSLADRMRDKQYNEA